MVKTLIAKSLNEALNALSQDHYNIVAGGTDMLIQNRSHTGLAIAYKGNVLYVNQIDELRYIKDDHQQIFIGATCRLEEILKSQSTPKLLRDIIIEMASPAIRHTATLAGNIANASPAGDSLLALYLLDASVKLQSKNNERIVKVSDFILGVRKIDLKPNEMITEIIIPKVDFDMVTFKKVAPRLSDAISKLSFAAAIRTDGQDILDIRFALGAVYMTVLRSKEIEKKYIGLSKAALKESVNDVLKDYEPLIQPIDDQRSNKVYRKNVALNLIKDFINKI